MSRTVDSAKQNREVTRVTRIGLVVNIGLSIVKFAGGWLGGSQAVVADALHSLSDSSTDIAILVGVRYWTKPPDADHPYGHHRIETIITLAIALVLLVVGLGLGFTGLLSLKNHEDTSLGWPALVVTLLSIAVKELLYRWNVTVGRRVRSSALIANAWHHRSDSLSSLPVAVAVGVALVIPEWAFLDHLGSFVVSMCIIYAAWQVGFPAFSQLIDAGAATFERKAILDIVLATPGVLYVHALRTRYVGSGLQADLHIHVAGDLTVREGHDIAGEVKHRLLKQGPSVTDVLVHVEPDEGDD
ncbi:cation transporter [bacterium]|nr:cation transporter [candidate division CSSED10-310 bacterium]